MTALAGSSVFDPTQAGDLIESDLTHWWFTGKAAIVGDLLRRFTPAGSAVLDLGAGAGGVSARLARSRPVVVIEGSADLAATCSDRGLGAARGLVDDLPVRTASLDAVTLLDVIEHLPDPVRTLEETRRVLRRSGVAVITVPAHRWLWSDADVFLGHVKRYTRRTLRSELDEAGFDVTWCSHVFSWLAPPVALRRLVGSSGEPQLGLDVDGPVVTRMALLLNAMERLVVRRVRLPFGTSIACVARPRR